VLARDDAGAPLVRVRRAGQGRVVALAVPFAPAALPRMNDPAFPDELADWLRGEPAPPRAASAQAVQPGRRAASHAPGTEPLARWLALFAAVLFVLERAWSSGPRTTGRARMNDAGPRVPDSLARWRRRARAQRAIVVLAAALPLVAAAAWLALRVSPAAFVATAATTLAATLALAIFHARRADLAHVARRAEAEQAALEDSATLAFADDAGLSPLQRLQKERVRERLARVPPPTREPVPGRVLAFAWLAALALVAINLVPGRAPAPRGRDGAAATDAAAVPPTKITRAALTIEPPAYTGLPPRTARELDARVETARSCAGTSRSRRGRARSRCASTTAPRSRWPPTETRGAANAASGSRRCTASRSKASRRRRTTATAGSTRSSTARRRSAWSRPSGR
jgi:hypothetical protein